jgi:Fic family protein
MDIEALERSPVGRLVPLHGNDARHGPFAYFAFLPDPLPDDLSLDSATWTAAAKASMALGKLGQVCAQLPDPRLLIRPALWKEALDTSALEGTVGALRDLLEARLPSTQFLSPETVEIRAYESMALHGFDMIKDRPISVSLLSQLQAQLFKDASDKPRDLGVVRRDPVWIGERDRPIQEARFVPPPADDRLRAGLDAWEVWVQQEHPHLPPAVRGALAHYQFETLHPFADGNGRLGRLVVVLQLLRARVIEHPAVTVSPWFLRRRDEYQGHLLAVSCTGNWNPWVQFFSQAVCDQCDALITGAERLLVWLDESRRELHTRRWTGAIHRLLEDLVEWPVTTIADTATRYDVTTMNATRMVNHLVDIGVLREMTGRSYARVFGAVYVIDTVEGI